MTELETILCDILKCDRASLYLEERNKKLSPAEANRLDEILKDRAAGIPLQYILGQADFMGLTFRVGPGVLIPRPETEILVDQALKWVAKKLKNPRILDIGTGSGNIAIAIAKSLCGVQADIVGVDVSEICLDTARQNAMRHGTAEKVSFLKSDIFSVFKNSETFDLIVSNPPYVAPCEYNELSLEVKCEPMEALVAEDGGLYFYRRIAKEAGKFLSEGGALFLEIGDEQAEDVTNIFSDKYVWSSSSIIKDFCGRDRIIFIEKATKFHG